MMSNNDIADVFSLLAKLMDVHGENSFKSKAYASSAFAIEKLEYELATIPQTQLAAIKGIGASAAQKITELLNTGTLVALEDMLTTTPPGILDMMRMKGIGPKKVHTIWKEMEIETVGELLYACNENRLKMFKGFGEKTQQQVKDIIEFNLQNKGSYLYATVQQINAELQQLISTTAVCKVLPTGEFLQQLPVINMLSFVAESSLANLQQTLTGLKEFTLLAETENSLVFDTKAGIKVTVFANAHISLEQAQILHSCTQAFLEALPAADKDEIADGFFESRNMEYVPAFLRDQPIIIKEALQKKLVKVIEPNDVHGLIHCHSNWSDGTNTIEEMAVEAAEKGLTYMLLTDHSKSAFYAHGLYEDKVIAQHAEIDKLNIRLAPFKIFKGIESDILNTGQLDYADDVLEKFDVIIGSVHSNLKMTEEKAMQRLLTAISNNYTSILGHLTGRLLLSRAGYPVNHQKIIEACKKHNVVIELNANPNRLDMDWAHVAAATAAGVMISVNPDAHSLKGIGDIRYGVLAAQKAQVTASQNLSSLTLEAFEEFVAVQKAKR